MIYFINCGFKKRMYSCKASEMYIGRLFTEKYAWIMMKAKENDQIFILSGKYGLLRPDEIINPYNLKLSTQNQTYKQKWKKMVINQLIKQKVSFKEHAVFATSKEYETFADLFPSKEFVRDDIKLIYPTAKIGYQSQYYTEQIKIKLF